MAESIHDPVMELRTDCTYKSAAFIPVSKYMKDKGTPVPEASSADGAVTSPLWTVKQLAIFLGVKPGTVYKMVERGELPVVRLGPNGRTLRFRREQVEVWLAAKATHGPGSP